MDADEIIFKRRYLNQLFYDPTLSKTAPDYLKKRPSVQNNADSRTDDILQRTDQAGMNQTSHKVVTFA